MKVVRGVTILMTSVGNDGFFGVIEALRNNGERELRAIGVDIRPEAPGLYLTDKAFIVSQRSHAGHINQLLQIMKREKVDILLPLSTEDQSYYSKCIDKFHKRGIKVIVSDYRALETANNKYLLCQFAQMHHIPHPRYLKVHNWEGLVRCIETLGYPENPFVLKLDKGTGAQGLKIVHRELNKKSRFLDRNNFHVTFQELHSLMENLDPWPDVHITEYLPGEEYSVDILCYEGEILAVVVRKRLFTIYGLATCAEIVDEPDIKSVASEIVKRLGLSYVVNVQVRRSASGEPKLMEVNPRIPGTISLTVAGGINMPYLALKLALGEDFTVPEPHFGTMILRHWSGVYTHRDKLLHG